MASYSKIQKLDKFTRAYIECALWSSTDNSRPDGGDPLDDNYDDIDIADKTLDRMAKDCKAFQKDNAELLEQAGFNDEQAGHGFWLTRNRHGTGFWDMDDGSVGEKLTENAHAYGSFDLYVGDDGKVYGS